MSATRRPRLTLSRYRAWLQSQAPTAVVGWRYDCYYCVIAQWLNALCGLHSGEGTGVWVGEDTWVDAQKRRHVFPVWAATQIARLDRLGSQTLTAAQALA